MKTPLLRLAAFAAALICCASAASAQSNSVNFENYPLGTLDTTGSLPWSKSGKAMGTIEEAASGGKFLRADSTGAGALILDSGHGGMNAVLIQEGKAVSWSFEFLLPAGSQEQTTYLRLNPGHAGAGKYVAGVAVINGRFAYLRNPNIATAKNSFVALGNVSIVADVWYKVEAEVTPVGSASGQFTYALRLIDPAGVSLFSQTVTIAPKALSEDPLRMTISLGDTSDLQLRNITLGSAR